MLRTGCDDAAIIPGKVLLDTLSAVSARKRNCLTPAAQARHLPSMTTRTFAAEIGKMALGVPVNKGVSYLLASLLRSPV